MNASNESSEKDDQMAAERIVITHNSHVTEESDKLEIFRELNVALQHNKILSTQLLLTRQDLERSRDALEKSFTMLENQNNDTAQLKAELAAYFQHLKDTLRESEASKASLEEKLKQTSAELESTKKSLKRAKEELLNRSHTKSVPSEGEMDSPLGVVRDRVSLIEAKIGEGHNNKLIITSEHSQQNSSTVQTINEIDTDSKSSCNGVDSDERITYEELQRWKIRCANLETQVRTLSDINTAITSSICRPESNILGTPSSLGCLDPTAWTTPPHSPPAPSHHSFTSPRKSTDVSKPTE